MTAISLGCWTRYGPAGPSSRLRCFQFLEIFRQHGLEPVCYPFLPEHYTRRIVAGKSASAAYGAWAFLRQLSRQSRFTTHQVHFIEKELFPRLGIRWYQPLFSSGRPYVLDYDDAVYAQYPPGSPAAAKFPLLLSRAAAICAGNPVIADYARQFSPHVVLIPTALDPTCYRQRTHWQLRGEQITIGWIGSATTAGFLSLALDALRDLAHRMPVVLETIGLPASFPLDCAPVLLRRLPWLGEESNQRIVSWDLGISPLADTPFTRGKSGLRILKFMLSGVPFVCSPVGINADLAALGAGLAADSPAQWSHNLQQLATDIHLRERLGRVGIATASADYTLSVVGHRLAAVLVDAAQRG